MELDHQEVGRCDVEYIVKVVVEIGYEEQQKMVAGCLIQLMLVGYCIVGIVGVVLVDVDWILAV